MKAAGKLVIQHSCGDIHGCFPDLLEIGFDCYQTFQPEVYDIYGIKAQYGDRLSFWGGVSTQQALPKMSRQDLQTEIVRVVNALRKDGGLIIAPTHAIPFDVPPENIMTMVEVFQNQDRYF